MQKRITCHHEASCPKKRSRNMWYCHNVFQSFQSYMHVIIYWYTNAPPYYVNMNKNIWKKNSQEQVHFANQCGIWWSTNFILSNKLFLECISWCMEMVERHLTVHGNKACDVLCNDCSTYLSHFTWEWSWLYYVTLCTESDLK